MTNKLCYRMVGYMLTIVLHVGNIIYMNRPRPKEEVLDPELEVFFKLQARYLTVWTFSLQVVYAVAGLLCDLLTLCNSSNKNYRLPKYVKGFRDTLFCAVVWPSSLMVFTLFWTIFAVDRKLVFPEFLDKVLAPASNHIMHTAILPIAIWEVYFQPRPQPRSHKRYLGHMAFHFALYASTLLYTYLETGSWIYPVLNEIYGTIYFPLMFLSALVFSLPFYSSQWLLVYLFHGSQEKSKRKQR